jgi:hypothetical protein
VRHLPRSALHGASAGANFAGNLDNAFAGAQLRLNALFDRYADPRAPERLAGLYGPLKPGIYAGPLFLLN